MFKAKKTDYFVAIVLIFLFLAPVISSYNTRSSGLKAVITSNSTEQIMDLSKNGKTAVSGLKVEIKNNSIRVVESGCPRQICAHSGAISKPGEIIVCVPNRVVIEIQGNDTGGFDAVSY